MLHLSSNTPLWRIRLAVERGEAIFYFDTEASSQFVEEFRALHGSSSKSISGVLRNDSTGDTSDLTMS